MKYSELSSKMKFVSTEQVAKGIPQVTMSYKRYADIGRSDTHIMSMNTKFTQQYINPVGERDLKAIPCAISLHEQEAVYLVFDPPTNEHAYYVRGVRPSKNEKPRSLALSSERLIREICQHLGIDVLPDHRMYCRFDLQKMEMEEEGIPTQVFKLTVASSEVEPFEVKKPKTDKNFAKVA